MAKRAHLVLSLVIILGLSSVFSVDTLTDVHRYSQVLITENANYAAAAKALRFWIAYSPMTAVVFRTLTGMEVPTCPSVVVLVLAARGTYMNISTFVYGFKAGLSEECYKLLTMPPTSQ
jgi:hypothetical protein